MIEAGVILEDAIYHNGTNSADGRFNNHFYAAQIDNTKAECHKTDIPLFFALAAMGRTTGAAVGAVALGNTELMRTNKALCMGLGARTDNIDWVFNKNVNLGFNRVNDYGLDDAFKYFKNSFAGTKANRTKYQAKLFTSLGFMIHMLQDLHSPAHCRDGSHPKGDYLEIYGRYDGGFYLSNGTFSNTKNNSAIKQAIAKMDMKKVMLDDNSFVSYEDFYKKEADWVGNNFFSESHNSFESANKETGEGLEINNFLDSDTIFDAYNPLPSTSTTYENEKDEIVTTGNTIDHVKGKLISVDGLNEKPIALIDKSVFGSLFDNEHMIMPTYHMDYREKKMVRGKDNTRALETTSINVMPRAVASSQAFINFFFRGQMKASLSADHTKLVIKNVSVKEGRVHDAKLLTFKRGGKFTLYVETAGVSRAIQTVTLGSDMKMNETRSMNISNHNLAVGTKVTVVYDGKIGDDMGGYNQYGIGMRGMSADVFEVEDQECEDPEMANLIKSLKELIEDSNNCVSFSNIRDYNQPKSIYFKAGVCSQVGNGLRYKNTELTNGINGVPRYVGSKKVIDYFNHFIYHFDEPTDDVYSATTSYSPTRLPNGNVNFNVSFNVSQLKNGKYNGNYNLFNLLTYTYLPSNAHVRSPHYHVTCNSSESLCSFLKGQNLGQYFNELIVENTAPYMFLAATNGLKGLTIGNTIKALNKYYGQYYGQYIKEDKYPKDWLKRMVRWIENYDCKKKVSKTNIFYDQTQFKKSSSGGL